MSAQQKRWLLLCGLLVSAVHFTLTALCRDAHLLLQRPEDMIGAGDTKPYWPPYPLADALERLGDVLRLPADWLWTQAMPDVELALLVANSCLWGFSLAVLFRFMFIRKRFHHEPKVA